ncbi:DUF3995 domain-containing protein [Bacillus sp. FJAT-49736]|uniref:DUF3995 domain-containing protein n=1 Tax=Bacillus sp. FJAT-49736 TaxID=2833582 RepID=UPI001BC9ECC9|nr:DUF3995 domain-containing protein [Bacillus sp. FJAT-49736]MBS4174445.1 DUF3995 domain-containing protein [Bacillus sp. FJAT-49736]MBS4175802.1 DUF3995 domain-containing protein [Bacillus sp. FJAT-49736]
MHKINRKYSDLNSFERFAIKSVWPAYIGCILAILYAVFVRFLEAAGVGIIYTYGRVKDPESLYIASYLAGVFIMLCGFCLLGLVKPWGKSIPQWIPLIGGKKIHPSVMLTPTLFGTAFLLAHGVSGMLTKALYLTGLITIHFYGWAELDPRALALWDLFFYEPWFFLMGILAGLSAVHYAFASSITLLWIRRCTISFLLLVLLLSIFFVLGIIFDYRKFVF